MNSIARKYKKVPSKAIILIGSNQHHNESFANELTTERVLLSKIGKERFMAFNKSEERNKVLKVHPSHNILGNNEELFIIRTSTLTQDNYITIITEEVNKIMRDDNYCIIGVVFITDIAQIKDVTQSKSFMKVFFELMKSTMPTLIDDLLLFINFKENGLQMEKVQEQDKKIGDLFGWLVTTDTEMSEMLEKINDKEPASLSKEMERTLELNKKIKDLLKVSHHFILKNFIGWFDATDTEMSYVEEKIDDKFENQWRELAASLSKQNKLSYSKFEYIYYFEVFCREVEQTTINLVLDLNNFEQYQTFQCSFELHKKENKTSKVRNQEFNKNNKIFSEVINGCKNGAIFGAKSGTILAGGAGIGLMYLPVIVLNRIDRYFFMTFPTWICYGELIGGLAGACTGSILSFIEAFFGVKLEYFYEFIQESVVQVAVGVMSGYLVEHFYQTDTSFKYGVAVGFIGGGIVRLVSSILNLFVKEPIEQEMQIKFEEKRSFEELLNKTFMKKISSKIEVVDRTFSRKLTMRSIPDWLDKLTIIMEGQEPQEVNVSNGHSSTIKLTKKTTNGRIEFRVLTPKIETIVNHLQRAHLLLKLEI